MLRGCLLREAVIGYSGQFYALFFLTQTLKVPAVNAQILIAVVLLGTPFFIVFGWLSDPQADHSGGLRARRDHLLPDLPGNHALRKSETGGSACQRTGVGHRRSIGVLVPVQSGWHCEVHHVVRHRQVSAGVLRVAGSRFWVVESPNSLYPLSVKNVPAYTADLLFLPLVIGRHKSIAKDIRPMRQLAKTFDSHNAYTRRNLLNSPFGICARKCRHQNYRTPQNNYKKRQRHKDYEP